MGVASGVQSPSKHNLIKKYKLKLRDYLLFLPKKLRKWKLEVGKTTNESNICTVQITSIRYLQVFLISTHRRLHESVLHYYKSTTQYGMLHHTNLSYMYYKSWNPVFKYRGALSEVEE